MHRRLVVASAPDLAGSAVIDAKRIDAPLLLDQLGIAYKRVGRELTALCPDPQHQDRKPSWSIRDQPGSSKHALSHCMSCGFGGGPVTLVCTVLDIDWDQARQWMTEHGLAGELSDLATAVDLEVVGETRYQFKMPPEYCARPLERWVTPLRNYATKRGLTPGQVERWRIGYAVDGRLAGRVVIPIFAEDGQLANYTGRALPGVEPRYLHAKREEHPNEGAVFGSHLWGENRNRLVVNEGELNALACERVGEACVAALSGSNVQPGAISLIASFDHVLILTDPDQAGDTAAAKLYAALARWRRVDRIRLPEGTDAAKLDPSQLRAILQSYPTA